MIIALAIYFAFLCSTALAFSNTVPVVAWSSRSSSILNDLPSRLSTTAHSLSLLEGILLNKELCEHDAIVLIDQPGLHASDLRTLPPSSNLARNITSAPSVRQFPFVRSTSSVSFLSIIQSLSRRCNSRLIKSPPGQVRVTPDPSDKHVILLSMPPLAGSAESRKSTMAEYEFRLARDLNLVALAFPNHFVILSGSSTLSKRQHDNSAWSEAGVLSRYQLLTPGLITTLLVVFFVLIPVVLTGISALTTIQSPLRIGAPQGYNDQEKKNQ